MKIDNDDKLNQLSFDKQHFGIKFMCDGRCLTCFLWHGKCIAEEDKKDGKKKEK